MDETEVWADIEGYEGRYQVSTYGRVSSLFVRDKWGNETRRSERLILKAYMDRYMLIVLTVNGKRRTHSVHTLVGSAFVPGKAKGLHCAHIDGVKAHNFASNLAWVTPKENEAHKVIHGTKAQGETQGIAKLTTESVREIRKTYKRGMATMLAEKFGVSTSAVINVAHGRGWRHVNDYQSPLKAADTINAEYEINFMDSRESK